MPAVLEVRDVRKSFAEVRAVDGLSFEVQEGEIFALLGPNGAGKTTLVRMLLEILPHDAGEIAWSLPGAAAGSHGRPSSGAIGYLPEERGLHRDVPVLRSLTYFGVLRGMDRRSARSEGERWLERLGLADRAKDKLDSLSKGNQQKIQFAAAVIHRPAFAVLDEPFSGFDPVNQERFLDHIRAMRDAGTTVLLSAHQMQLVERLADRILLIDRGRAVLAGTFDELRAQAGGSRKLVLATEGRADPDALLRCEGVRGVESVEDGRAVVSLTGDGRLNATLEAVARCTAIVGIHDERPSLHDLYVDAVRRGEEER